jgi:hypothetical protein
LFLNLKAKTLFSLMAHQKSGWTKQIKRSAVGGTDDDPFGNAEMNDDPFGNAEMNKFLRGYKRITCADACKLGKVALGRVTVWMKRDKKWEHHRAVDLLKGQDLSQSICRALVTRLYGWTPWQYESLRDTFDDKTSKDVMGIYANDKEGLFAIIGRLPVSDRLVRGAIGIGGIMTGVGGMLLKDHLSLTNDDAEKLANDARPEEKKERILDLQLRLVHQLLPLFAEKFVDNFPKEFDIHKLATLADNIENNFDNWKVRTTPAFDSQLESAIGIMNDDYKKHKNTLSQEKQGNLDRTLQRINSTFAKLKREKNFKPIKPQ